MIRIASAALLALSLSIGGAVAQSGPNGADWTFGQVPTAGQWNSAFRGKQDYLGAPPLLITGGTMTGKLITATPGASAAGLTLPHGAAPTSPVNGDLWTTTTGLFARINGATVGPYVSGATALAVGNPISGGATNNLLYDAAGNLGVVATANNGVLVTNGSGAPSISTTLPSGLSVPSPTITGSPTFPNGSVPNAALANASTTVNGTTCTLGSTCTITATAAMVVGTTTITSGTNGRIEYNNAGVLGELPVTGTAGNVVLSQSPTISGTENHTGTFQVGGLTMTFPGSAATLAATNLAQTFTKAQRGSVINVAISTATFTPNFDNNQNFEIDLTSACPCTLANPSTSLVAGQSGIIEVHQDGTGSRTIGTWGSAYQFAGGTSTITLSTAASAIDYIPYYTNAAATGIVLGSPTKNPTH